MNFSVNGKCVAVLEPQKLTSKRDGSEIIKHGFVLEVTDNNFTKKMCFTIMGNDKFVQWGIKVGGSYSVNFDVSSREWNGRWFTELNCWNCTSLNGGENAQNPQPTPQPQPQPMPQAAPQPQNDNSDGLPF